MKDKFFTIVSSGPDWLTVSGVSRETSIPIMEFAEREFTMLDEEGVLRRPWGAMGYRGWQMGSFRAGVRKNNEAILIASGDAAIEISSRIPLESCRVTRFDLQVTLAITPPDPNVALREYHAQKAENEKRKKKRSLRYISSNTGDTLYVGSRRAKIMLRLYDKGYDYANNEKGELWRYEVEFKGLAAVKAFDAWRSNENRPFFTVQLITAEYQKRGILPGFSTGTKFSAIEVKAVVSTAEGKLSWLLRCVAPVVTQLLNLGYEEQVLHALKLKNIITQIGDSNGVE